MPYDPWKQQKDHWEHEKWKELEDQKNAQSSINSPSSSANNPPNIPRRTFKIPQGDPPKPHKSRKWIIAGAIIVLLMFLLFYLT